MTQIPFLCCLIVITRNVVWTSASMGEYVFCVKTMSRVFHEYPKNFFKIRITNMDSYTTDRLYIFSPIPYNDNLYCTQLLVPYKGSNLVKHFKFDTHPSSDKKNTYIKQMTLWVRSYNWEYYRDFNPPQNTLTALDWVENPFARRCRPGYRTLWNTNDTLKQYNSLNICQETCASGRFGRNCNDRCNCKSPKGCQAVDGQCFPSSPTCVSPIFNKGPRCDRICDVPSWGPLVNLCLYKCNCYNGEKCNWQSGQCHKCPPLRFGPRCQQQCPHGKWGRSGCTNDCNCQDNKTCDPEYGSCGFKNCAPGYKANEKFWNYCVPIKTQCKGQYGPFCEKNCHCLNSITCDTTTGKCEGECDIRYFGPLCQNTCYPSKFNDKYTCDGTCHCLDNNYCMVGNGKCWNNTGCEIGYSGDNCQKNCSFGSWMKCSMPCNCQNNEKCDTQTGKCQNNCNLRHYGPKCQATCEVDMFLISGGCYGQCYCTENKHCRVVDGSCAKGTCQKNHAGDNCQTYTGKDGYYLAVKTETGDPTKEANVDIVIIVYFFNGHHEYARVTTAGNYMCDDGYYCLYQKIKYSNSSVRSYMILNTKESVNISEIKFYQKDAKSMYTANFDPMLDTKNIPFAMREFKVTCSRGQFTNVYATTTATKCRINCPAGRYDYNCTKTCHCTLNRFCNRRTGACFNGKCAKGYAGQNCQLISSSAAFGSKDGSNGAIIGVATVAAVMSIAFVALLYYTLTKRTAKPPLPSHSQSLSRISTSISKSKKSCSKK